MRKIIILFILFCVTQNYVQAQENSENKGNAQINRMNNMTPEQMNSFMSRMNESRNDFASLKRYRSANDSLGLPTENEDRVVFYGNSITDWWVDWNVYFADKPYINRGIAGQTTPQLLIRFKPDVVHLKPKVVVILAGINDITGMTGPTTNSMIEDNISSMVEIAQANGIKVILASVLPCYSIVGRPDLHPADRVVSLNQWIQQYAKEQGCIYLDYFTPLADKNNGLKEEYTKDGVHPNKKGYDIMTPLVKEAINRALH